MKNNEDGQTLDIEKIDKSKLVKLTSDMTFNYPTQQLKDEVFNMFMSYVQSLETELDQTQKDHVFHFRRLYDFYDELETHIGKAHNIIGIKGNN